MIRNRSVSHVHIHASIIFTSIITNSDHFCLFKSIITNSDRFWTLLVRYFRLHMQLSSIDFKISFDSKKWMSHFLSYLFASSKKLFCACLTILVIIQLTLYTLSFSFFFFFKSTLYFTLFFWGTSHILNTCLHRFYILAVTNIVISLHFYLFIKITFYHFNLYLILYFTLSLII